MRPMQCLNQFSLSTRDRQPLLSEQILELPNIQSIKRGSSGRWHSLRGVLDVVSDDAGDDYVQLVCGAGTFEHLWWTESRRSSIQESREIVC